MPEVSIIVAAYNGERFIKEALESLLAQTFDNFEIVVVDDGSTDSTAEIVKSFEDERVKYFHKENSGNQAIPRNFGIKKTEGKYIAFCDQDDLWYPTKLEKQMERNQKDAGIFITSADIINENGKKIGERLVPKGYLSPEESFEMLLNENFITACSAIILKKVIEEVGFLNEKLSGNDDYDLEIRVAKQYGILGISEPLCAWRRSKGSFSHDMSRVFKENQKIFSLLKADNEEQSEIIKEGKNKNLLGLFLAYVKEGQYDKAKEVLPQIRPFTGMMKFKIFIKVFRLSPSLSGFLARANSVVKKST